MDNVKRVEPFKTLPGEEWKSIPGYDGYEASDLGRISRIINGHRYMISPWDSNKGYLRVAIFKKGKQVKRLVSRLVAIAWIPNPDNKPQVNHINGNKHDNTIGNLEWTTGSENVKHAVSTGLTSTNIKVTLENLVDKTLVDYDSLNQLSKALDMAMDTLVTYIPRSKKYPIYGKFVVHITEESIDQMLNTFTVNAKQVYVYDCVTKTTATYASMAHAAIYTGVNTYTVREALGIKNQPKYYNGGYVFSYAPIKHKNWETEEYYLWDRDRIWSKPYNKNYTGFECYNYDTKEVTTYDNRNDVANAVGCTQDEVTRAVVNSNTKLRTWLLRGYGIRSLGSVLEWYQYPEAAILNSKVGLKFDLPVFKVTYPNGDSKYKYGVSDVAKILGITPDTFTKIHKRGQAALNKLVERSGINVTVTKIE
jgi:hypothetical protein